MPKVSIIIPVYNAEANLNRCIDSVLNQEFTDFELILMDDGSKDSSPAILDSYAAADSRVKVVHKANSGVSDTRNQALDLASGTYIQFMDADDWITKDATQMLVRSAENTDADLVIADFYRVVGENVSAKGDIDQEGLISRETFADYMVRHPADFYYGVIWNKLFKRSILEEQHVRMDTSLSWCEDFIFNLEYLLYVDHVFVLKVPVYYYVKTEGSLVAKNFSLTNSIRMKFDVIEYYSNFYKNIYDKKDYAARRPQIAGFLIDFSKDGFSFSIMPGTKKLGKEGVLIASDQDFKDSSFRSNYLEKKLLERKLAAVCRQHDLDEKEALFLFFIYEASGTATRQDAADYASMNAPSSILTMQKFLATKVLVQDKTTDSATLSLNLSSRDNIDTRKSLDVSALISDFESIVKEVQEIKLRALTPSEQATYLSLEEKEIEEMRNALV